MQIIMKTKMKSVVRRFYQPVCLVQNAVEQVNFTGKWLVMPAMGGEGIIWNRCPVERAAMG